MGCQKLDVLGATNGDATVRRPSRMLTYLLVRDEAELCAETLSCGTQVRCAVDHVVQLDHASQAISSPTRSLAGEVGCEHRSEGGLPFVVRGRRPPRQEGGTEGITAQPTRRRIRAQRVRHRGRSVGYRCG